LDEVINMTEKLVTTDDVPIFKTIDGHRYKYHTFAFTKKGVKEIVERFKNWESNRGKKISIRIVTHGLGGDKEYRIYFRRA
jgi:hypothetical protein